MKTIIAIAAIAMLSGCLSQTVNTPTHTTCVNSTTTYHTETTNITIGPVNAPIASHQRADTYCSEWRSA